MTAKASRGTMAPTERYRLQRGAPLETNRYVREVLEEKGAEVKIAVAFKVVPDDQDIQVASDGTLDFSKAKGTVSTYDLNALEAAAQLAAANPGSTVTAVTVGAASIDDSKLKAVQRLAIILGTEGDGLDPETIARCDCTVCIPMAHGVDSLNVAAASAVAFWQLRAR